MKKLISSLLAMFSAIAFSYADEAAEVRDNLKNMPRPWAKENYSAIGTADETYEGRTNFRKGNYVDWSVFESSLEYWDKKYDFCKLDVLGKTLENDPMYCMTITNFNIPADKKFKILMVASHGGAERSALQSAMAVLEYLVSDKAKKFHDYYEIKVIPCGNIFGYFRSESPMNSKGIDPYAAGRGNHWDIKNLVPKKPENTPELVAFCKILDEMKPELLVDFHGVGRLYPGIIMTQYIGCAGSNHVLRPWATDLITYIRKVAAESGTPCYDLDEEIQRLVSVNEPRKNFPRKFRDSGDFFYSDMYPYLKYHTMPIIFEVSHENMAADAVRGILQYGMNPPKEADGSLPVDNLLTDWGGFMVQAWGTTPGERRESRVELWNKLDEIQTWGAAPPVSYRIFRIVTIGSNGEKELIGNLPVANSYDTKATKIFKNRPDTNTVKWSAIDQFIKLGPEGRVAKIYNIPNIKEAKGPANGISLAFDIQISEKYDVDLLDIRLNGVTLKPDARDGYQLIKHSKGHRLIVNVPPEKSAKTVMYIVSCAYNSNAPLQWGWQSPAEIPITKKTMPFIRQEFKDLFTEGFENRKPNPGTGDYYNGKSAWGFFMPDRVQFVDGRKGKGAGIFKTPLTAWCRDSYAWDKTKSYTVSFDFKLAQDGGFVHNIGLRTKTASVSWGVEKNKVYTQTIEAGKAKKVWSNLSIDCDKWYTAEVRLNNGVYELAIIDDSGKKTEIGKFTQLIHQDISFINFTPINKSGSLNIIIDNIITK